MGKERSHRHLETAVGFRSTKEHFRKEVMRMYFWKEHKTNPQFRYSEEPERSNILTGFSPPSEKVGIISTPSSGPSGAVWAEGKA